MPLRIVEAAPERQAKGVRVVEAAPAPAPKAKPKTGALDYLTGLMANVNRGLGVGDELAAAGNTALSTLKGAVGAGPQVIDLSPGTKSPTLDGLRQITAEFERQMGRQRAIEDTFSAENPNVAALGRGTGMAATMAVTPAGTPAEILAQSPRALNMLRGATGAGLTAAGYAAADRGTLGERAGAAADAAKNPIVLAIGALGGAIGPAKLPQKPKVSPEVIALRAKGVPLTPGQARGGTLKALEDAGTSLPILGTAIQDARRAGTEGFVRAAANDALAPVGLKVPDNIAAGHDMVAHVEKTLGKLYDDVVPKGGLVADPAFKASIGERVGEIAQDMTPAGRKTLEGIFQNRVLSRLTKRRANPTDMTPALPGATVEMVEAMDGPVFQRVNSELGTVQGRYSASPDADQRAIAEAIGAMREELHRAAGRQDPVFAAAKTAIDKGYASFKRLQGAAASPGAEGGVFTAAQYGGAARRGDRSVDKGATARGSALGQDLAKAGRAVLPSKVPDSGTATRGMIGALATAPGAIGAGFATGGPVGGAAAAAGIGATLASLKGLSRLYTPKALANMNARLDRAIVRQDGAAVMKELELLAQRLPGLKPKLPELAQKVAAATGVIAASQAQPAAAKTGQPPPK